ncbi:MAG: hypothetical protein KatS3mg061_0003 [Dehalococcoidia bacterium]|nr:MAG: hypothetical protein KatS3mg061_0003 [Dehalococcoidia bacterium]
MESPEPPLASPASPLPAGGRLLLLPLPLLLALALPWSIWASILANLLLRASSFAASVLLSLKLATLASAGEAVDAVLVGLLAATFYLVEVTGAPVVGLLGDRFGQRGFLLAGPLVSSASVILLGLTGLIPLFFAAVALKGVAVAASVPSTLAYLSYATRIGDTLRTRALAYFEVGSLAGIGLGGFSGGLLRDLAGAWAFALVALLDVAALLFLLTIARQQIPRRERSLSPWHDLGYVARLPALLRFLPTWLAVNVIIGLWVTHLPFLLAQPKNPHQLLQGGFPDWLVGLAYAAIGVTMALGVALWGNLLAGRPRTLGMTLGMSGLFTLGLLLLFLNRSGSEWGGLQLVVASLAVLAGLVATGFTPAALAHLADLAEEHRRYRGTVMGLYSVLFGLGQVSGALLGGPAARTFGADGLILLTLLFSGIALLGIRLLRR